MRGARYKIQDTGYGIRDLWICFIYRKCNFEVCGENPYFVIKYMLLDLSVIIVNYNVKYFLEQCLYSVIKACSGIQAEIFVVDNNSSDGSRAYFEGRFPGVEFTWQKDNTGFAKANNTVLRKATGYHILFLNPDTIIPEDCFEKCIGFFNATPDCGALGVKMIDGSGKYLRESKRSFPSPLTSFFKMAGFTTLFPTSKVFAGYYAGNLPENRNNEVDVLAGAFMMLKRQALEKVKGFDEDFFMYGEDIDLSYRIQLAGFKNYYFSETAIIHFKGESTQKNSISYVHMFYDAMKLFVKKHYGNKKMLLVSMQAAIGLSRSVVSARLLFKKAFMRNTVNMVPPETAIMASQQDFDSIIHLLRNAPGGMVIKGRIAIDENDKGTFLAHAGNTASAIRAHGISQLLFCEGEISYKSIIALTEQLQGTCGFLFHAKQSKRIVGSNNKNQQGVFIAA